MQGVIQSQASDGAYVGLGQRRQQRADTDDLVRHLVFAKDVASDDACLLGFGNVADSVAEDGIAVVGLAVLGQEADEPLSTVLVTCSCTATTGS